MQLLKVCRFRLCSSYFRNRLWLYEFSCIMRKFMTSLRSSRNCRSCCQVVGWKSWPLLFELYDEPDELDDGDTILVEAVSYSQLSCWAGILELIYELGIQSWGRLNILGKDNSELPCQAAIAIPSVERVQIYCISAKSIWTLNVGSVPLVCCCCIHVLNTKRGINVESVYT